MEALMQYVWEFRLWPQRDMHTVDGARVSVIDVGRHNRDAGPDFFNAKVQIDGQMWIGNIEIHIRASDWYRHGHDKDPAYDNVVLHVVEKDDAPVHRSNGEKIPQMVMTCARDFSEKYNALVNDPVRELPCSLELASLPSIYVSDWLTALGHERLFAKSDRILGMVKRFGGSWTDAIYVTLARALGFNTNSEPFELLACTTPLKCMLKHSDSLESVEAILFGQAGLLGAGATGEYAQKLAEEYRFLATKYGLTPSQNIMWKMGRMRPQNFPYRRIATLAAMVCNGFKIGSALLEVTSEEQARELFDFDLTGYWARHFTFSESAGGSPHAFSYSSVTVLIINTVVPILYAYAESIGDTRRQEMAKDLLQSLKPESNSIVDIFSRAGLKASDAYVTQALIQLRKEYCLQRKCLFCRIGHKLLSQKVKAVVS